MATTIQVKPSQKHTIPASDSVTASHYGQVCFFSNLISNMIFNNRILNKGFCFFLSFWEWNSEKYLNSATISKIASEFVQRNLLKSVIVVHKVCLSRYSLKANLALSILQIEHYELKLSLARKVALSRKEALSRSLEFILSDVQGSGAHCCTNYVEDKFFFHKICRLRQKN